jgi:serine phosphatase RsbU (regulator of sigma subunit)
MSILLDLRDQVRAQGEPPVLEDGWVMARGLRSAGDAAFRGDFTLAAKDGPLVQAMVVDVSGHGTDVAPRAVQLAGAFGGLLRVVDPQQAVGSCNTYVVRQDWDREYATAAHAILDQRTGEVELRCAGHPAPRVRREGGSWEDVAVRGPALGLVASPAFPSATVALRPGDVLVLVSDGALDERSDDAWRPVEQAVDRWWADGAANGSTVRPLGSSSSDDQTILVLGRRRDR